MIIPWKVDVPQDRLAFINWLIIAAAIFIYVLQQVSIMTREGLVDSKMAEYQDRPLEDMVKDFKVDEKTVKKIETHVDKTIGRFDSERPSTSNALRSMRDTLVKRAILDEYYVWGEVRPYILNGWRLKGFIGHMWLHGDIIHLLGNMLFLWIFGNSVCAKIGNLRYVPLYLGLGFLAGLSQLLFVGGSCLGASGAIFGIVGMFLVFFPENEITCYFIFFLFFRPIIKEFSVSSIWMILFWIVFNVWGVISGGGHVAYFAHLGGFAGGVVLGIAMLKLNMITMEKYEKSLLQLIDEHFKPVKAEPASGYYDYLNAPEKEMVYTSQKDESISFEPKSISLDVLPIGLMPTEQIPLDPLPLPQEAMPLPVPPLTQVKPKDDFIRFECQCGKKLKMPAQYAGKKGKCPKCGARIKIPEK